MRFQIAERRADGEEVCLRRRDLFIVRSHAETITTTNARREWTIQQRRRERRLTQNEIGR